MVARQDTHGSSGFRDKVDRHYTRLVRLAVLTSLFSAASEIAQNQNRSLLVYPSPGQIAGSAAGQQASDLGARSLAAISACSPQSSFASAIDSTSSARSTGETEKLTPRHFRRTDMVGPSLRSASVALLWPFPAFPDGRGVNRNAETRNPIFLARDVRFE